MNEITRQEVDAKIAASEARTEARIAHLDAVVKTGFAEIRAEFAEIRAEFAKVRAEIADLRADMAQGLAEVHQRITDIVKWAVTTALGIAVAVVAILSFVINTAAARWAPPAQSPAPVSQPKPQGNDPQAAPPNKSEQAPPT
jgi:hypothetical protein